MENTISSNNNTFALSPRVNVLIAISLSVLLYGSYFYNLIRQQLQFLVQKQTALESIKVIAVPGSVYLKGVGSLASLNSSLFYLILIGVLLIALMIFSLFFASVWRRALLLLAGLLTVIALTFQDRVNISFPIVIALSFSSFFLLTLDSKINLTLREILVILLLVFAISFSLLYGSKNRFFLKTRDLVLSESVLGNGLISFYYAYSPLAASVISPEQGVYQGLIYKKGFEGKRFQYLGNGLFLSGKEEIKGIADFEILKDGDDYLLKSRYGTIRPIESVTGLHVQKSIEEMFSMKGFMRLTKLCLYFFPAGVFLLLIIGIRSLTHSHKVFIASISGVALLIILFIVSVSLSGNNPAIGNRLKTPDLSRDGIPTAYFLDEKGQVPETYASFVKSMAKSESPAIRYWGTRLLGKLADIQEVPTLTKLLEDPNLNVRSMAAESLYIILKENSFNILLVRLFKDPSWYVKYRIFSVFLQAGVIPSPA